MVITPRQYIEEKNTQLIHTIIHIEYNMHNMPSSTLHNMGVHLGSQKLKEEILIYIYSNRERKKIYNSKMRKKEE